MATEEKKFLDRDGLEYFYSKLKERGNSEFETLADCLDHTLGLDTRVHIDERNADYIVGEDDESTTDGVFKILHSTGKYLYLQHGASINFEVTGQVPEEDREYSKEDMKPYMDIILARIASGDTITEIVFNEGTWLFSPTCINLESGNKSLNIRGSQPVRVFNGYAYKAFTSFAPIGNQTYIIKLGGNPLFESDPTGSRGLSLTDIRFTSIQDDTDDLTSTCLSKGALYIDNNSGGVYPNLDFYKVNGVCLAIRASFELDFGVVNIRTKANYAYDAVIFDDLTGSASVYNNVSSCNFQTLRMENIAGSCIYIDPKSAFDMNTINYFELENNYPELLGAERFTNYTTATQIDHEQYVFHGMIRRLQIGHMNISSHAEYYGRYNNENYRTAGVFCYDVPTTETNRHNRFQVGEILIRMNNNADAAIKMLLAIKKYACGNELIEIGNVYIDTAKALTGSLFRTDNCYFNRIKIGNIHDDHEAANYMAVDSIVKYANYLNTGCIRPLDNSVTRERLGAGGSGGQSVVQFNSSVAGEHTIRIGVAYPEGGYKFTVVADGGNVVVQDTTPVSPGYAHVTATIDTTIGSQVKFTIASTTPNIVFDYVKE